MNNEKKYNDDFKKLFDAHQVAELPVDLEEQVMLRVELHKMRAKRSAPKWLSTNFVIFCTSLMLLALLSVFQFATQFQMPLLLDVKLLLLFSTGAFFILWIIESTEEILQNKFSRGVRATTN